MAQAEKEKKILCISFLDTFFIKTFNKMIGNGINEYKLTETADFALFPPVFFYLFL